MQITLDTKQDTAEEIQKLIEFLKALSGSKDIVVDAQAAFRPDPEVSASVASFFETEMKEPLSMVKAEEKEEPRMDRIIIEGDEEEAEPLPPGIKIVPYL